MKKALKTALVIILLGQIPVVLAGLLTPGVSVFEALTFTYEPTGSLIHPIWIVIILMIAGKAMYDVLGQRWDR